MSLLDAFIDEGLSNPAPFAEEQVRRTVYIAIRNDGSHGNGTPEDPYDGSTRELLDSLLRNPDLIRPNMTIRFGPGTFRTRGGSGSAHGTSFGWEPQAGQKLIGAGMYQTTLQLVDTVYDTLDREPPPPGKGPAEAIPVIGRNPPIDGLTVSDMTLDCNLSRLPLPPPPPVLSHAPVAVTGITLFGDNIVLRRVRVINWGTYTPLYVNGESVSPYAWECFPIYLDPQAGTGPNIAEDCIVEQPNLTPARECTLMNVKGNPYSEIRNCLCSGQCTTGTPPPPVEVLDITWTGGAMGVVTVKTRWPHLMQAGDLVWLAGSSEGTLNDRHLVDEKVDEYTFKILKTGSSSNPNGTSMSAQRHVPPAMPIAGLSSTGALATLKTGHPHRRKTGDWIRVSGAEVNGSIHNPYNGSFLATRVDDKTLTYAPLSSVTAGPTGEIWLDRWPSDEVRIIDVVDVLKDPTDGYWRATFKTATAHYKAIGEYAWITRVGVKKPGTNPPEWLENNVYNGWFEVLEVNTGTGTVPSIRCRLNTNLATLPELWGSQSVARISMYTHGTSLQSGVNSGPVSRGNRVVSCTDGGPYHDTHTVKDCIIWDNYYYWLADGKTSQLLDPDLQNKYTEDRTLAERNIAEIRPHDEGSDLGVYPASFWCSGWHNQSQPLERAFATMVFRKNIGRTANGALDPKPNNHAAGVSIASCQDLIIQNNLFDFRTAQAPVRCQITTQMACFNNQQTDGKLLPGLDRITGLTDPNAYHVSEIGTEAEDLFLCWWSK